MLIQKDYKRNLRTGDIVKRETVEVACDRCGRKWTTVYANRKRRTLEQDFCKRCRCRIAVSKQKTSLADRRWHGEKVCQQVLCLSCGKDIERSPNLIRKRNFCDIRCRDAYLLKSRYGHLPKTFRDHPDEVSYLFGMILGDGHLKKSGRYSTRVSIACDATGRWEWISNQIKEVLSILRIEWKEEPKIHDSCSVVGFVLTNDLLDQYGMLFHGSKMRAQPKPCGEVVENINFAVGLINSDGSFDESKSRRSHSYWFRNTVESVVHSFKECLNARGIDHKTYFQGKRLDDRTGNFSLPIHIVCVGRLAAVEKLRRLARFRLKGE